MGDSRATKPCPFCAELIAAEAVKCRFCKSMLKGGARYEESRPDVRWHGNEATARDGQSLGEGKCVNCGGAEGVQPWTMRFTYTPPWVYVGLLAGLLPAAILAAIFTRRGTLTFSRCAACKSRMFRLSLVSWLIGLGGLVAFPMLGGFIGQLLDRHDGTGAGIGMGFLVWFVALIVLAVLNSSIPVKCSRIDNGMVTVKFKKPQYVKA